MSLLTKLSDKLDSTRSGVPSVCSETRAQFSAYLDGELSGRAMAFTAGHLAACDPCAKEFEGWRAMQQALSAVGPARLPAGLQASLRDALLVERAEKSYLSAPRRFSQAWTEFLAPAALRVSGGLAMAFVLLSGLCWCFGSAVAVQANDDRMAHLIAPSYLYSQVPPAPILTRHGAPLVVEAMVDTDGRVYDYAILDGPRDIDVERRVQENLLASVFKPATVFGVPVNGHVVMTYSGVNVQG